LCAMKRHLHQSEVGARHWALRGMLFDLCRFRDEPGPAQAGGVVSRRDEDHAQFEGLR
jgi:hypothetical protein